MEKVNGKSEAVNNFNVCILRFPSWLLGSHKVLLGVDLCCLAQRRRRLLVITASVSVSGHSERVGG